MSGTPKIRRLDGRVDSEPTEVEIEQYQTYLRTATAPRGVVAQERARADRDRALYADLHRRHLELQRRLARLEVHLGVDLVDQLAGELAAQAEQPADESEVLWKAVAGLVPDDPTDLDLVECAAFALRAARRMRDARV